MRITMPDMSIRPDIRFMSHIRFRTDQVQANYHNHVENIRITMPNIRLMPSGEVSGSCQITGSGQLSVFGQLMKPQHHINCSPYAIQK
jgi:hypothetical protein